MLSMSPDGPDMLTWPGRMRADVRTSAQNLLHSERDMSNAASLLFALRLNDVISRA